MKLSQKIFIYFAGCSILSLVDIMYRNYNIIIHDHCLIWGVFLLFTAFELFHSSADISDELGNSYHYIFEDGEEDEDEENDDLENEEDYIDNDDYEEDDDFDDDDWYQDLDETYGRTDRPLVLYNLDPETGSFERREII